MTLYDALEVHVEIAGETMLAGHAQFHRSRGNLTSTTFQYDPAYLAHTSAYQLDPALQLVSGTQQTQGLPGAFSDSAPDRWGRNLIKKRERLLALQESRRPRDFDDADFLAGVSDITRQGALRYRAETGAGPVSAFLDPDHDVPRLLRLPELLHAADTASRNTAARDTGDDGYEAVKLLLAAGTGSLGGARPKAAVLDNNDRQLIAKFVERRPFLRRFPAAAHVVGIFCFVAIRHVHAVFCVSQEVQLFCARGCIREIRHEVIVALAGAERI